MENTVKETKSGMMLKDYTLYSESELAYLVFKFDSKALEEIYNRYSPLLYSLINEITYKNDVTEEILSEVFSLVWRKIDHFDYASGNFYTWVITLARNKAVDYVSRNRDEAQGYKEYSGIYEDFYMLPILSPKIDPLKLDSALSLKEDVDKAITKLSDVQKYIIHLIYYEGFTVTGISKKLNISRESVIEKVRSALNNFTEHFLPEGYKPVPTDDDRIYLYAAGCMDTDDYPEFINSIPDLSENSKEVFGIYQIISSLLPVIIDIKNPMPELKNKVARKLMGLNKHINLKRTKNINDLRVTDSLSKTSFDEKYFIAKETKQPESKNIPVQEAAPQKEIPVDNRPVLVERPAPDYETYQQEKLALLRNAVKKDFKKILLLDLILVILISALIGGGIYYFLSQQIKNDQAHISNLNNKISSLNNELSKLNVDQKIFTLQNSKDTKSYPLDGTGKNTQGFGTLKISGSGKEGLLSLHNMPELPEEKVYQLWLISKGQPFSLGVFSITRSNEDLLINELPEVDVKNIDSFLLTIEDAEGSSFPSDTIYLSRKLK